MNRVTIKIQSLLRVLPFLVTVILLSAAPLAFAQIPVPFIGSPLVPDAVSPGGSDFT